MKTIAKLQYITRGVTEPEILSECTDVLKGGCTWIQLRMKNTPLDEIITTGKNLKTLCNAFGATLIINDNPSIVRQIGADGVHLGKSDMPVAQAREMLGDKIIGATANTASDVIELTQQGVDYIGLGPFRFTTTKKNLSPVIGLQGYLDITNECKEKGISATIVAIGGIDTEDVKAIMATGIYGIAISGAIGAARDVTAATKDFLVAIEDF